MNATNNDPDRAFPMLSRRELLLSGGAALLALPFAGGCSTTPEHTDRRHAMIGTHLYGWGQYYERAGKKMGEHMDEVLSAVRDCGYHYAEGTLDLGTPENNAAFAERCKARGLRPVSFYSGGRLHDESKADEVVGKILTAARVAKAAGYSVINCNPDPIGREKTDPELATQVAALKKLGAELNRIGMHLGVHHHTPEMRNDAREFHYNFQNSDPKVVGFCYDVHWVFRGGLAPEAVLPRYGNRIVSWHLRQSRDAIWWEDMDRGDIDYGAVADYARRHTLAPLFTVELALENGTRITRSVVENHRRSREFVQAVFRV
jgi:inosose dehydratase